MTNSSTQTTGDGLLEYITSIASPSEGSALLTRYYLQSLARDLLRQERVAFCMRRIIPTQDHVAICKRRESKRAFYKNLIVCGSIWNCPVCAAQITEERRRELTAALEKCSLTPVLITYTVQHHQHMPLKTLLSGTLEAYRRVKSGKGWQLLMSDYGWRGSVRSLEVTHGANGWHPHIHELALLEEPLTAGQLRGLETALKGRWQVALQHEGYTASWQRGVDVEDRDSNIREYVAKFGREPLRQNWTIEHELTKAPTKKGRLGGRTPLQLLADYGDEDYQAGQLFKEYAACFKGRNQLVWSRGLRALLNLGAEVPDQQLAEETSQDAELLAKLTPPQWKLILKRDLRGELLARASNCSVEDFSNWLAAATVQQEV